MSPEEAKELKPLNTAALKVLTEDDSEDAIVYINELLKTSDKASNNQNFWFPTPNDPGDPNTHTPIQSRKLREIKEQEETQKLNPTNSDEEREAFSKTSNGMTHNCQRTTKKTSKKYSSNLTTFLPGIDWTLESTTISKLNSRRKQMNHSTHRACPVPLT